ncbi:MAG: cation diffusion facilitator family transporter [Dehalococcoidia bacterium]
MRELTQAPARFWRLDVASRAAALSLGSNAVLMVAKLSVGLMFGSVAVLSDGVDSAQDVFASGLAFFAVRLAMQPADEAHPYGHGKTESLAALSQAALIAGGATFIAVAALRRMFDGGADIDVGPSLAIMAVTAVVNLAVAAYAMRAARISESVAIAADARHLLTNVVQAAGVIFALTLVGITGRQIFDPLVALAIAAYLAYTVARITADALRELIDSSLPDEEVAMIEACLATHEHGLRGFHAMRTRKSGREKHIDLHVLVDPAMTVSAAHLRIEEIESDLRSCIPGAKIAIHVDPDEPDIMERGEAEAAPTERGLHLHKH